MSDDSAIRAFNAASAANAFDRLQNAPMDFFRRVVGMDAEIERLRRLVRSAYVEGFQYWQDMLRETDDHATVNSPMLAQHSFERSRSRIELGGKQP